MTTTTINAPITLGDDFPYKEALLETLSYMCNRTPERDLKMVAYWLTPEEQLLKYREVEGDLNAVAEMHDSFCGYFQHLPAYCEDEYRENVDAVPPVDFENDDADTAIAKFFVRHDCLQGFGVEGLTMSVLCKRPGDVTEDGKEVQP